MPFAQRKKNILHAINIIYLIEIHSHHIIIQRWHVLCIIYLLWNTYKIHLYFANDELLNIKSVCPWSECFYFALPHCLSFSVSHSRPLFVRVFLFSSLNIPFSRMYATQIVGGRFLDTGRTRAEQCARENKWMGESSERESLVERLR